MIKVKKEIIKMADMICNKFNLWHYTFFIFTFYILSPAKTIKYE